MVLKVFGGPHGLYFGALGVLLQGILASSGIPWELFVAKIEVCQRLSGFLGDVSGDRMAALITACVFNSFGTPVLASEALFGSILNSQADPPCR